MIFVADRAANVIRAFGHDGSPLNIFPGLIGPGSTFGCGFPIAAACASGAFSALSDLAAGPDGSIYAVDIKTGVVRLVRLALEGGQYRFDREWNTGLEVNQAVPEATSPRVAVDQLTHEIFVANNQRYVQFEGPTADETKFVSAPFPPVTSSRSYSTGIAVQGTADPESDGRLYVDGLQASLFSTGGAHIDVYDSDGEIVDPPEAVLDPVDPESDVTATTASVSGTVVPQEEGVMWRFEHRRCTDSGCDPWPEAPPAGPPLQGPIVAADYSQPQPVSFLLEGLEPNSDYEVRLRAVNSTDTDFSEPGELTTKLAAPDVATQDAASVSAWRATLVARVNPRNADTRYFFEFGVEGGEQIELPAEHSTLAGDSGVSEVTAEVRDLEPDTAYQARVVAYTEADQDLRSTGDIATFRTRVAADSALPERGFELVSSEKVNAIGADAMMLSPDGNRALYRSLLPFPDSTNAGYDFRFSARNEDGSWTTSPHWAGTPVRPEVLTLDAYTAELLPSSNLSYVGFDPRGAIDPDDQNDRADIYLRNIDSGAITWIAMGPGSPVTEPISAGQVYFVSDDGSQVIFGSNRRLLPSDESTGNTLYEWKDGVVRQVAYRPGPSVGTLEAPTQASFLARRGSE